MLGTQRLPHALSTQAVRILGTCPPPTDSHTFPRSKKEEKKKERGKEVAWPAGLPSTDANPAANVRLTGTAPPVDFVHKYIALAVISDTLLNAGLALAADPIFLCHASGHCGCYAKVAGLLHVCGRICRHVCILATIGGIFLGLCCGSRLCVWTFSHLRSRCRGLFLFVTASVPIVVVVGVGNQSCLAT